MPIYEYRCDSCGHELEKIQRMADAPLTDCPDCGEQALRRLVSAAGFRLKGGGWYETDFKKDGKKNLHDAATPQAVSAGNGSSAPSTPAAGGSTASAESKKNASESAAKPSAS